MVTLLLSKFIARQSPGLGSCCRRWRRRLLPHQNIPSVFPSAAVSSSSSSSSSSKFQNVQPFSSLAHPTIPCCMAKVEILSLDSSKDGANNGRGILKQVLPVGSQVAEGAALALIQPLSDDGGEQQEQAEDIVVVAPHAGRILEIYKPLQETVQVGDILLDLDDVIEQDFAAWRDHMAQHTEGQVTDEFLQTYLELDDPFRLQQVAQMIKDQFLTILPMALPLYERILELQQQQQPESNTPTEEQAQTRTELGVLLYNLGDAPGAVGHLEAALKVRQSVYGDDHPQVAASHIHLGAIQQQTGDASSALEHMGKALEIQAIALGEDHPMIASSCNNVGALYYQLGKYQDALQHYDRALKIHTISHGEDEPHSDTAGTRHNRGTALKHLGDYPLADTELQRALSMRQALLEKADNPKSATADVAASHYAMGQLWAEMGKYDGALEQYHAALELQESLYGKESPITASGHNNIGAIYYQQGNFAQALESYRTALEVMKRVQAQHPDTAAAHNNVGLALYQTGQFDESMKQHTQAKAILVNTYGPEHPALATTIGSIGNVYKAQNQWGDALTEYRVAHTLLEQAFGPNHPDVASSYNNQGYVYTQLEKWDDALESYQAAAKAFGASLGAEHPHTASCHFNCGLVWKSQGDLVQARKYLEEAHGIWERSLGAGHPTTEMATNSINECM